MIYQFNNSFRSSQKYILSYKLRTKIAVFNVFPNVSLPKHKLPQSCLNHDFKAIQASER